VSTEDGPDSFIVKDIDFSCLQFLSEANFIGLNLIVNEMAK
jgi:hypothetical protein